MKTSNYSSLHSPFTGEILRENNVCATIKDDKIMDFDENAPIYIQRTKDFTGWLEMRGADYNRSFMRAIARVLKLPMHGGIDAVKQVNAACITDTFWIRTKGMDILYSDTVFKNNDFFKAALIGDESIFNKKTDGKTPELTNIGSFNKGWLLREKNWVLCKSGSSLQYFSEMFTGKLGSAIGIDSVEYYMLDGFIACDNFVKPGQCFEPAKSIIGNNIDYMFNAEMLAKYGLLHFYLDLIFLDAIVFNVDRHEFNYGVLTEPGKRTSLAPNFDNNLALFGYTLPKRFTRTLDDVFIRDFLSVAREANDYKIPVITEEIIGRCINETLKEIDIPVSPESIFEFTMSAYGHIITGINQ